MTIKEQNINRLYRFNTEVILRDTEADSRPRVNAIVMVIDALNLLELKLIEVGFDRFTEIFFPMPDIMETFINKPTQMQKEWIDRGYEVALNMLEGLTSE